MGLCRSLSLNAKDIPGLTLEHFGTHSEVLRCPQGSLFIGGISVTFDPRFRCHFWCQISGWAERLWDHLHDLNRCAIECSSSKASVQALAEWLGAKAPHQGFVAFNHWDVWDMSDMSRISYFNCGLWGSLGVSRYSFGVFCAPSPVHFPLNCPLSRGVRRSHGTLQAKERGEVLVAANFATHGEAP